MLQKSQNGTQISLSAEKWRIISEKGVSATQHALNLDYTDLTTGYWQEERITNLAT